MFKIETTASGPRAAEHFKTAFYRFLETNPPPLEEAAWLEMCVVNGEERPTALLWSQQAADAFQAYAANLRFDGYGGVWINRSYHQGR